jgi:hypothetical protein
MYINLRKIIKMKLKNNSYFKYIPIVILIIVCFIFFYQTFLFGKIPFPGDLLLAEYNPWRHSSYAGYNPGSLPNKGQYFDSIREFYPWLTLTISQIKKGILPLWNPYNFSGTPHLANYQSAVFNPLNIVYFIFDQKTGWTILIILQPLLTSIFTYLYSRKIGISVLGSLASAFTLSYATYLSEWLEFGVVGATLMWIPLILFSIELLRTNFSMKNTFIFVGATLLSLFSGYPLDFFSYYIFVFIYCLVFLISNNIQNNKSKNNLIKEIIKYTGLFLVPIGLGSIQLWPTLSLLLSSARIDIPYDFLINHMLVQPGQLVMILVPDFFGNPASKNYWLDTSYVSLTLSVGIVPIILVLNLITNLRQKTNFSAYIKFFLIIISIIFAVIIRSPITEFLYHFHIPLISSSSPTRLLSIYTIAISILAGIGVDYFQKHKFFLKIIFIFLVFLTLSWLSVLEIDKIHRGISIRNLILPSGITLLTLTTLFIGNFRIKYKNIAVICLISLIVLERFFGFQKFNPFSAPAYVFPQNDLLTYMQNNFGIDRFYGYGTAKIEANLATQYRLFSADGFDAMNLIRYNSFIRSSLNGKIETHFNQDNRSVAEIAPGYGGIDLAENVYRLRIMDMLGVKYILDRTENPKNNQTFPASKYKQIWNNPDGWIIYQNLNATPRFFLSDSVKYFQNDSDFENKFFDPGFDPTRDILLDAKDKSEIKIAKATIRKTKLVSYEPNLIKIQTVSDAPQMLFLSDNYDDGWRAQVDSQPTKIYRTNFTFRSVYLTQGTHLIQFKYQPDSFRTGLYITLTTLSFYLLYILYSLWQTKINRKN